jgi:hypothetical protein
MEFLKKAVSYLSGQKRRLCRYYTPEFEDETFDVVMDTQLTTCGTNAIIFYNYINNKVPIHLINIFWNQTTKGKLFDGHGFNFYIDKGRVLLIHSYYQKFLLRMDIVSSKLLGSFLYNFYLCNKKLQFSDDFCREYKELFTEEIKLQGEKIKEKTGMEIKSPLKNLSNIILSLTLHSYVDTNYEIIISYLKLI